MKLHKKIWSFILLPRCDLNQSGVISLIPRYSILVSKILWLIVLKVFWKSRNTPQGNSSISNLTCFYSIIRFTLFFCHANNCVLVEWIFLVFLMYKGVYFSWRICKVYVACTIQLFFWCLIAVRLAYNLSNLIGFVYRILELH